MNKNEFPFETDLMIDIDHMKEFDSRSDKLFRYIWSSVFFASLGVISNCFKLPRYTQTFCLIGLILGAVLSMCFLYKEHVKNKLRRTHEKKVLSKIKLLIKKNEILTSIVTDINNFRVDK